jgi:hypothetical protein
MRPQKVKKKEKRGIIYDKYRRILNRPTLTEREIDEMRNHTRLLARTICEHVWGKKFY